MEFWNSHDGTIQLISDVHPLETATNSFERPKLVAIKGNISYLDMMNHRTEVFRCQIHQHHTRKKFI